MGRVSDYFPADFCFNLPLVMNSFPPRVAHSPIPPALCEHVLSSSLVPCTVLGMERKP